MDEAESEDLEATSEQVNEEVEASEEEDLATENDIIDEDADAEEDLASENDIIDEDANEDTEPLFSSSTSSSDSEPDRKILGMTLTIRNKVGGVYTERPERTVRGKNKWSIEYALEEMNPAQTKAQYDACILRRKRTHTKSVDMTQINTWNDLFIQTLKRLSSEGRLWREKEDLKESKMPIKTLYPMNGKNVMGRPEGEEAEREKAGLGTIQEEVETAEADRDVQGKGSEPKESESALDSLRRTLEGK